MRPSEAVQDSAEAITDYLNRDSKSVSLHPRNRSHGGNRFAIYVELKNCLLAISSDLDQRNRETEPTYQLHARPSRPSEILDARAPGTTKSMSVAIGFK